MMIRRNVGNGERGQVLILCAVSMVVLLLFVGLAVDFGLAYVTKARLGKAVDAAALTAAKHSSVALTSTVIAQSDLLAQSSFAMNYGSGAPTLIVTHPVDSSGNTLTQVNATATINTYFLGLLPQFRTLNVSSSAQAKSARIVMTLVLDRSGSMVGDLGAVALPPTVKTFIGLFDDVNDSVALVTFANNVTPVIPMPTATTGGFVAPVTADSSSMTFTGSTWSDGALKEALNQEISLTIPPGANVNKVVVFFTDGKANIVQGSLTCTSGTLSAGVWDTRPRTWNFQADDNSSTRINYYVPGTNGGASCHDDGNSACCNSNFTSISSGSQTINWTNVKQDAENRAIAEAVAMRALNITVYSIGLSSSADTTFLCKVANAPCSLTYDSTKPVGDMQFAPTSADLEEAFKTIAADIHLRLTQ